MDFAPETSRYSAQNWRKLGELQLRIDFAAAPCILLRFKLTRCSQLLRTFPSMGRTERQREIARRRKRKVGLTKLREKFAACRNEGEKAEILAKARRMSPFVQFE
jgi:hypothetical protein